VIARQILALRRLTAAMLPPERESLHRAGAVATYNDGWENGFEGGKGKHYDVSVPDRVRIPFGSVILVCILLLLPAVIEIVKHVAQMAAAFGAFAAICWLGSWAAGLTQRGWVMLFIGAGTCVALVAIGARIEECRQ
jgi:hypothetical protein